MGDVRFEKAFATVEESRDRASTVRAISEPDLVRALAGASRRGDPYMANILATELLNRQRRNGARLAGVSAGALSALAAHVVVGIGMVVSPLPSGTFLVLSAGILLWGVVAGVAAYARVRRSVE